MLRKTYRLMQKTRDIVQETGDGLITLAAAPLHRFKKGNTAPLSFHACPPDIWTGNAAQGNEMIAFIETLSDEKLAFVVGPMGRAHIDPSFHRFDWLRDLRTVGTFAARECAMRLIGTWVAESSRIVDPVETRSIRLFNLIGGYGFFAPALPPSLEEKILAALSHDLESLKTDLKTPLTPMESFLASASLAAATLALQYDSTHQGKSIQQFEGALTRLILSDGGPVTRRPIDLVRTLITLLNVRHIMNAAGTPVPIPLTHAIDRVVPALRFFRMGPGNGLATFHGSNAGDSALIDQALTLSHLNGRSPASLPYTGFERLSAEATTVILDTRISSAPHHASATAFEMTIGAQRLIVNCGQHRSDLMWQDLLSATSAHSTLVLDHTDNRPARGPATITPARRDTDDGQMVEVQHDGYLTRNGFSHTRRLFLSAEGDDLRGQDDVVAAIPPVLPLPYSIRFHLHPRVSVNALQSGKEALLKLPDGSIWRFAHDGDSMRIEDSVYLSETGLPQKTRQIVIDGKIFGARKTVRWAIRSMGSVATPGKSGH